jgi:hypothetical protein
MLNARRPWRTARPLSKFMLGNVVAVGNFLSRVQLGKKCKRASATARVDHKKRSAMKVASERQRARRLSDDDGKFKDAT